ncbi:MAG: SEL1-like repeat protein, partial [Alphaproteobacteria bacterium]|nr:SEL1-like repeat protein [Alphaproteobacteria bacterium]
PLAMPTTSIATPAPRLGSTVQAAAAVAVGLLLASCGGADRGVLLLAQVSQAEYELPREIELLWQAEANRQVAARIPMLDEAATDCDKLAGDPLDENKVTAGIVMDEIEARLAVRACATAADLFRSTPRLRYQLARAYSRDGQMDQALPLLDRLAEESYPLALEALGSFYYARGQRAGLNVGPAVKLLERAAENGAANAAMVLAGLNAEGRGVPRDQKAAVRWLRRAVELGQPRARTMLARLTLSGVKDSLPADPAAAVKLLSEAAERNEPGAMYLLATLHRRGVGTKEDRGEAAAQFRRAAEWGHPLGQASLGIILLGLDGAGDGQEAPDEALFWLRRAEQSGVKQAASLAKVARQALSPERAAEISRRADEWRPPGPANLPAAPPPAAKPTDAVAARQVPPTAAERTPAEKKPAEDAAPSKAPSEGSGETVKRATAPAAAKPDDAKLSDAKPGEAKPTDAKPTDAKPTDAKQAGRVGGQSGDSALPQGESKTASAAPPVAKPETAKPEAAKPEAAKPEASAEKASGQAAPKDAPAGATPGTPPVSANLVPASSGAAPSPAPSEAQDKAEPASTEARSRFYEPGKSDTLDTGVHGDATVAQPRKPPAPRPKEEKKMNRAVIFGIEMLFPDE